MSDVRTPGQETSKRNQSGNKGTYDFVAFLSQLSPWLRFEAAMNVKKFVIEVLNGGIGVRGVIGTRV